jgi:hypothetical protein
MDTYVGEWVEDVRTGHGEAPFSACACSFTSTTISTSTYASTSNSAIFTPSIFCPPIRQIHCIAQG